MNSTVRPLPNVVSSEEWRKAREALLVKEKELTHARDALAAERRRLPMEKIDKRYVFEGPQGPVSLVDLFEGRSQLLLYHFMFAPGVNGWPTAGCPGCSMFIDNVGQFARTHVAARDISFAVVSRAPLANLEAYRERMSWNVRWVSSEKTTFNTDFGLTKDDGEYHGPQRVPARRRERVSHVLHLVARPRNRGHGLVALRSDPVRPAGGMGGLAKGMAANAAVSMVATARRVLIRCPHNDFDDEGPER